jgi:hypothetical protein
MAAINFTPDSPSNGDTFTANGVTYTYDGTKWKTSIVSNDFFPNTGGTVSGNIVLDGELQHSGDTDTNIAFDTDTILFDTAGSERFRVGSAGQLGIGGATYGSDGQVLTSTGASSAPAWEDIPDSGITWLNTQATTSGGAVTVTGIPTTARMIVISFYRVSQSSGTSNQLTFRVGNGSIDTGTSYYWSVSRGNSYNGSNTAQTYYRMIVSAYTTEGFNYSGSLTLLRTDDTSGLWSINHQLSENGSANEPINGAGSFNGSSIDRVQLIPEGSFDNGSFRVGYIL